MQACLKVLSAQPGKTFVCLAVWKTSWETTLPFPYECFRMSHD